MDKENIMELSSYSVIELIDLYSSVVSEFRKRGVLRTNNVVGELGEYIVIENYLKNPQLPNLNSLPVGTQNVNAISQDGNRYSIKSISSTTTSVFYGLEPPESKKTNPQLFEYLVICKFGNDYSVEGIYELDWNAFLRHKKWNSRMKAWNIQLTNSVKNDSRVIYSLRKVREESDIHDELEDDSSKSIGIVSGIDVSWTVTKGIDHKAVRKLTAEIVGKRIGIHFFEDSTARFVDEDKETALFVTSASYSTKNKEYWYSINDEIIPWLETFPESYIAFAMGGENNILLFKIVELKNILPGCLRTNEDSAKKKVAHYHISFSVEGKNKVFFKQKKPDREFVNVSDKLIKG